MGLDLNATMDALGTRLKTIPGLRVYDFPPDSIAAPAAVVSFPAAVEYDQAYRAGADSAVFTIHAMVGKVSDRASRDAIGAYVGRAGPSSVKTILESEPTLGGVIQSLRAERAALVTVTVGEVEYLAASFDVEVYA